MKDYFSLAFNNLRRRKLRSWLTMIGIFIGIAAVVALISLGQGLQGAIEEQFNQIGTDKIIVQAKTLGPPGSNTDPKLILGEKDLEIIKKVKGVEEAEGAITRTVPIEFKNEIAIVLLNGLDEEYINIFGDIDSLKIIKGRQLKNEDRYKAVVGYNHVFGELWDKSLDVGNRIIINGERI